MDDDTGSGSPVLLTVDGSQHLVTLTARSIVGIGLKDGQLLWRVPFAGDYHDTTGTPIVAGQTVIVFGQGAGALALKIEKKGDGFAANQLWKKFQGTHHYNTPVLREGLLFGMNPRRNFFCMDAKTGEVHWTDTAQHGQCSTILSAGSVLLALTSDSELIALQPSRKGYAQISKYRVSDSETWAYPIIAGNRIYVKDKAGTLTLWVLE